VLGDVETSPTDVSGEIVWLPGVEDTPCCPVYTTHCRLPKEMFHHIVLSADRAARLLAFSDRKMGTSTREARFQVLRVGSKTLAVFCLQQTDGGSKRLWNVGDLLLD
jgi:hypothetical protein